MPELPPFVQNGMTMSCAPADQVPLPEGRPARDAGIRPRTQTAEGVIMAADLLTPEESPMKVSTYALHTVIALAATVALTTAQASMANACGSNGHASMGNACGSNGHAMKKSGYGSKGSTMKNSYKSKKGSMKNACGS